MNQTDLSNRPTPRWSARVAAWLIALAAVPLVGTGWFAYAELKSISDNRDQAATVSMATADLIQITELNAQLLDERNWVSASAALEELGLPSAMVTSMLGVDIDAERAETIERVDGLIAQTEFESIVPGVAAARSVGDKGMLEVGLEYVDLTGEVEQRAIATYDDILEIAGDTTEASTLVNSLRVLNKASQASQAVTVQFTAFFGTQFAGEGSTENLQTLIGQQARYDFAIDAIRRIAPPGSNASRALSAIDAAPEARQFRAMVDGLIATPPDGSTDISAVADSMPQVVTSFGAAANAVDSHLAVVQAAHDDVIAASEEIAAASQEASAAAVQRVVVLALASLLFAAGVARAIVRPLRQLAEGAEALRDGQDTARIRPSGPTEIRAAMTALNEAAGHIDLAGRQAEALAAGSLDHPVLEETATGSLGESLQSAVQTLATSLSQREDLADRLRHEATYDGLTQLLNRAKSLEAIREQIIAVAGTKQQVAITFLDLDDFKLVNDHYGHPTGDEVLATLGRRLAAMSGGTDVVGRIGGDEFVVISTGFESMDSLVNRARSWLDAVSTPIAVNNTTVRLGASAGIAVTDGRTEIEAEDLLREADLAVYEAKASRGTGAISVCDDELRAEQRRRAEIEAALRSAIDEDDLRGELELHFQPILAADGGELRSAEALLRWTSPMLGRINPDEFIPIAERGNLILDLDRLVMRKATAQLAAWSTDPAFKDLSISVNVSAGHIANHSFVDDVLGTVEAAGVDPHRVIIEVTESALLDDLGAAAGKLSLIRDRGIRVAIDDFGTGYTSLGQLRRLPVDILKIDRSFIADQSAQGLVELIISMGHLLGADVVAEGIETAQQASLLADLGADGLQGFLYARPCPAAEFRAGEFRADMVRADGDPADGVRAAHRSGDAAPTEATVG